MGLLPQAGEHCGARLRSLPRVPRGGVHVIPLSQVMTCVLPQPLHRAELWWH